MNLFFYFIKILNIMYIGIFYFIIGSIVSSIVTKIQPDRNKKIVRKMSTLRLYSETVITASFLFIIIYFCRKIVKYIGSPFNNIAGFDFYRLKELNGGIVLSLSVILFSPKLIDMSREIGDRFSNNINNINNINTNNNNKSLITKIKNDLKLIIFIIIVFTLLVVTYIIRHKYGLLNNIQQSYNKANTVAMYSVNSANSSNSI